MSGLGIGPRQNCRCCNTYFDEFDGSDLKSWWVSYGSSLPTVSTGDLHLSGGQVIINSRRSREDNADWGISGGAKPRFSCVAAINIQCQVAGDAFRVYTMWKDSSNYECVELLWNQCIRYLIVVGGTPTNAGQLTYVRPSALSTYSDPLGEASAIDVYVTFSDPFENNPCSAYKKSGTGMLAYRENGSTGGWVCLEFPYYTAIGGAGTAGYGYSGVGFTGSGGCTLGAIYGGGRRAARGATSSDDDPPTGSGTQALFCTTYTPRLAESGGNAISNTLGEPYDGFDLTGGKTGSVSGQSYYALSGWTDQDGTGNPYDTSYGDGLHRRQMQVDISGFPTGDYDFLNGTYTLDLSFIDISPITGSLSTPTPLMYCTAIDGGSNPGILVLEFSPRVWAIALTSVNLFFIPDSGTPVDSIPVAVWLPVIWDSWDNHSGTPYVVSRLPLCDWSHYRECNGSVFYFTWTLTLSETVAQEAAPGEFSDWPNRGIDPAYDSVDVSVTAL